MAILFSPPFFRATDIAGQPIPGAFLSFYKTGTSSLQPIWADVGLSIPLTNPLPSDGNGWFPAIWLDDSLPSYKFALSAPDVNTPTIPGAVLRTGDPYNTTISQAQTAAEASAGVTPVNLSFDPGDVRRYGAIGDGVTDDSDAIAVALTVASTLGLIVRMPSGYSFLITKYVQILSNTTIHLQGKLLVSNRTSGLFANGASNIGIYGFKVGQITDPAVQSNYVWNAGTTIVPAIHLRSVTNAIIDGVTLDHVCAGIQISNANSNSANGAAWVLNQGAPYNVTVRNCTTTFAEFGGVTCYGGKYVKYLDNHVERCGDGGMWIMGGLDCEVRGNTRISPYSLPADVASFGNNIQSKPTTWNDEQGLEFENCQGLLIADNVVKGMWAQGIDIKNNCNRVLCTGNRVSDCENGSIVVRDGDSVKNACHKVAIIGNTVSGHGTLQFSISNSVLGAIRVGECFIAEISNNVIHAYQTTAGINCLGPGTYQGTWYGANPHQASLIVSGNSFDFKNNAFQTESPSEIGFTASTLSAIIVNGQYDSVQISDNKISTDRYLATDPRINAAAAIAVNQVNANSAFYPTGCTISGNEVSNWGFHGISIAGFFAATYSGFTINGNSLSNCAGSGIRVNTCHKAVIIGNNINQPGSGSGWPGIDIAGSSGNVIDGVICTNNAITGRFDGTNAMTYCIHTDYAANINLTNNVFAGAATATISFTNIQGSHVLSGSTGFPRTAAASPSASVTSYWQGEEFWDSAGSHWWKSSAFNTTTWTQLSN